MEDYKKRRWRVNVNDEAEIWEVYEADNLGWCDRLNSKNELIGRAQFPTLERATLFVLNGFEKELLEELPVEEENE